jgi:hypothetical protein
MPKQIKPYKILISFDEVGKFSEGIFIYQTLEDSGELSRKYNTVKINAEINVPVMNGIIQKAISFAKKTEGVQDA